MLFNFFRRDFFIMSKAFSIVIPIFNEEKNIEYLIKSINEVLKDLSPKCEVIAVNDGSSDNTLKELKKQLKINKFLRIIDLKRNKGQTAAIMAGLDYCSNELIIIMDADSQNDPSDIPKLIKKIDEGYDVVSGWRKNRKDPYLTRVFPSKIANIFISWISGVKLHDHGCSLKAYKKNVLSEIKLYGEMHRFISIYAKIVSLYERVSFLTFRSFRHKFPRVTSLFSKTLAVKKGVVYMFLNFSITKWKVDHKLKMIM